MSLSALSESHQNYLKVIWSLTEWHDRTATTTEISERLGVRPPTVSGALKKLKELGLVDHSPYGAITLTPLGRRYAIEMVRRHRLIETFLVEVLDYAWDEVHDEAERLEHAVSTMLVDRIDAHLGHPTADPHGDPIPSPAGKIEVPDAVLLTEITPGTRVRVVRIADSDSELLQYFGEHSLTVGAEIAVTERVPYSDAVKVTVAGRDESLPLGRAATDAVWVSTDVPEA